jgi:hypothetical protein
LGEAGDGVVVVEVGAVPPGGGGVGGEVGVLVLDRCGGVGVLGWAEVLGQFAAVGAQEPESSARPSGMMISSLSWWAVRMRPEQSSRLITRSGSPGPSASRP